MAFECGPEGSDVTGGAFQVGEPASAKALGSDMVWHDRRRGSNNIADVNKDLEDA